MTKIKPITSFGSGIKILVVIIVMIIMVSIIWLESYFVVSLLILVVFRHRRLMDLWLLTLLVVWNGIVVIDNWDVFDFHRFIIVIFDCMVNLIRVTSSLKCNLMFFFQAILENNWMILMIMMKMLFLINWLHKLVHVGILVSDNSDFLVLFIIIW